MPRSVVSALLLAVAAPGGHAMDSRSLSSPLESDESRFLGSRGPLRTPDAGPAPGPRFSLPAMMRRIPKPDLKNTHSAEVIGVHRNSAGDSAALTRGIIFNLVGSVLTVALFVSLMRCVPRVYSFRTEAGSRGYNPSLPVPRKGLFGWACAATSISDQQIVEVAGLDGLLLVEYYLLCRRILSTVGAGSLLVLCPMHYFASKGMQNIDLLSRLSVTALLDRAELTGSTTVFDQQGFLSTEWFLLELCWVHAVAAWIVVLLSLKFMDDAHHKFLQCRFDWLMKTPAPRATTLMVENIPQDYRSDEALREYFVRLFSADAIDRAYIVRRTGELRRRIARAEELGRKLASAEEQWTAASQDPAQRPTTGGSILCMHRRRDAIDEFSQELQGARAAVKAERDRVEAAVPSRHHAVCSTSGFVTFACRRWCRLASREQFRADASQFQMTMPPDPADVIYTDLAKDPAQQAGSNWISRILTLIIFVTWMPIVVTISGMTRLNSLKEFIPAVRWFCERFPVFQTWIEGVLATIALRIFMAFLPSILICIIERFHTLKAGAWAQHELQNEYFNFLVLFVLVVTAINKSLLGSLEEVIDHPKAVILLLADALPDASHFYFNYIILGWLTTAVALTRYWNLLEYLVYRMSMAPEEARQKAELENQHSDGMGARMATASLMMTITLVFCTSTPLINAFAWVFFFFGGLTYRYLVVYAEIKKPDLGGPFWVLGLKHLMMALCFYITLIAAILFRAGRTLPAYAATSAFVPLIGFYFHFNNLTWESLPYEAIADIDYKIRCSRGGKGVDIDVRAGDYVQAECVDPNAPQEALAGSSDQAYEAHEEAAQ